MAFSYILFEVLDLDGSNFQTRYPLQGTAIAAEVETDIIRPHFVRLPQPWIRVSSLLPVGHLHGICHCEAENLPPSAFNSFERRGYRTVLPRSSISDDPSAHA